VIVFESAAIALYLTDKFPKNRLGPVVGERERGPYLSWLAYYTGIFEPAAVSKFMNVSVPQGTAGWVPMDEAMATLVSKLTANPYLLGERFTAADVLFGTTFALFANSPLLPKSAAIDDYVKRVTERPAFIKAQGLDQ
jgi:glutathione S-transferase